MGVVYFSIIPTFEPSRYYKCWIVCFYNRMKQTSVIVNVGRKVVFNEEDLFTALKNKSIGGAVLDIFERIPNPVTNRFRRLRNVVVLPGVSAISQEVNGRLKMYCEANLLSAIEGKKVVGIVNEGE